MGSFGHSATAVGWVRKGLVWLALGAVVALRLVDPEPLPTFRTASFDFAQTLLPAGGTEPAAITIVDIDEASLAELGQWPWPRDLLADLVTELARHRPSALGVNILFPEADRLSPESVLRRFPIDAPLRESLAALPANDSLLAFSLRQAPSVLGAVVTTAERQADAAAAMPVPIQLRIGQKGAAEIHRYPGLLRNLPILEEASSGLGVVSMDFAGDGVVRRMPVVMLVGDAMMPAFAMEVVRVARRLPSISVEIDGQGVAGVGLGDLKIETSLSGEVWLREVAVERFSRLSAAVLLRGGAPPELVEDRIVLLGTTGSGLARGFVTPGGTALPALDMQAVFIENLLSEDYLLRPSSAVFWELLVAVALLLGILALRRRLPGQASLPVLLSVPLLLVAGSLYAFDRHGLLLDPSFPALVFALTFLVSSGFGLVEAQRQRRRSEEEREMALLLAEAANRSKTSFLANMSHELRTPLNAILGFSEMMKLEILGPVQPPKYREYIDDIYRMGSHLLLLVNDILEMSKVEAGKSQLTESEFPLLPLVEDCIRTVSAAYRRRGTEILLERQSPLPLLRADRRMVTQMVMNLLSNAVKYTPDGGRVRVTGRLADNGGFRLSVSDTGIGMSEREIFEAFEPFRRIDHALASNFEGIGLGLPLTKAMIELHGGKLDLSSISNHGTTATLVFPGERVCGSVARRQERA